MTMNKQHKGYSILLEYCDKGGYMYLAFKI